MEEKQDKKLGWALFAFFVILLLICVYSMWYGVKYVAPPNGQINYIEPEQVQTESGEVYEIEVIGEVCNIYEIVGDCSTEEIIGAEVYVNGGTAKGQSYIVEKDVAPNLLQALIDVVFQEADAYQQAAITYGDEYYGYSIIYEFATGEIMTFYIIHADMVKYNGVVYKSHEEIEWEVVHYGIREGFGRGNPVKDIE